MHADKVTVVDLIEELEACDPDAEVRLAQQPAWPFEYAIDREHAAVQVQSGDGDPVVYLGEGAQLGLPARDRPPAARLVASPPALSREAPACEHPIGHCPPQP